jgi:hypothetical protein
MLRTLVCHGDWSITPVRRLRTCAMIVSGLLLGSAPLVNATGASAAGTAVAASSARVYAANCGTVGYLEYKPQSWGAGCTSGSPEVRNARWTRWNDTSARGVGSSYVEDCSPSCATPSKHEVYPSSVILSQPRRCTSGARVSYFSRATWTITYPRRNPFHMRPGNHSSIFRPLGGTVCRRN